MPNGKANTWVELISCIFSHLWKPIIINVSRTSNILYRLKRKKPNVTFHSAVSDLIDDEPCPSFPVEAFLNSDYHGWNEEKVHDHKAGPK